MPSPSKTRTMLPLLFGQSLRNRVLVSLALERPSSICGLARKLDVHQALVSRAVSALHFQGLLLRGPAGVDLAPFFASEEMHALLRRLGGASRGTPPGNSSATVPRHVREIFGGGARTGVLALLSTLGSMPEGELQRLLSLPYGTVRHAVAHLASEGVIRTEQRPPFLYVGLNRDFIAARELAIFARAVAGEIYDVEALRGTLEAMRREAERDGCATDAPTGLSDLIPFGDELQRRALLELARRDVVSRPRLATLLGRTPDSTKGILEGLFRHRLAVGVVRGSGPQRRMWVALDPRHPLAPALRDLACALCGDRTREQDPRRPHAFPDASARPYGVGEVPACLPGEEFPNAVMLALHRGQALDVSQIRSLTGISKPQVVRILAELSGRGLVRIESRGARHRAWAAQDGPWSPAVMRLLGDAEAFIRSHYGGMNPRHRCMGGAE